MTIMQMTPLFAALQYAGRGLAVFPLRQNMKTPATPNGFHDSSTDPEKIEAWFRSGKANIGIATGNTSGVLVIDVDSYAGGNLEDLEIELGVLPNTREVRTRAGGRHLYFRYPSGVELGSYNGKLAPHVDLKANGGYVVAPPSYVEADHKGVAGQYVWANNCPMAELPDAWIQRLASLGKLVPRPQLAASARGVSEFLCVRREETFPR